MLAYITMIVFAQAMPSQSIINVQKGCLHNVGMYVHVFAQVIGMTPINQSLMCKMNAYMATYYF